MESVALCNRADTLGLLSRRHEPIAVTIADTRDTYYADGFTNGGTFA